MKDLTNHELTVRLLSLEQAFNASTKRSIDNTYTAESANSKADALTPTTFTKTAYIGDSEVVFTDVPSGNISVFAEGAGGKNPYYVQLKREQDRVTVVYEPLKEVTTITLSII